MHYNIKIQLGLSVFVKHSKIGPFGSLKHKKPIGGRARLGPAEEITALPRPSAGFQE